jgi:MSHA pilin protein MshA
MYKSQKGFTLVELVVVIVLLGILGVTALGKFQNLSVSAQTAANEGIASELSAASSINLAAAKLGVGTAIALTADGVTCTSLVAGGAGSLLVNALPTGAGGYTVGGASNCGGSPGGTFTCTITENPDTAATNGSASVVCTN